MLSTTVEPECRQRPFVISCAMACPRSGVAADTVGPRAAIGAAAKDAPVPEATKVLGHATIHPAAVRVEAYGATARANSPAVHRRGY
jgi:hypothetical protein